MAPFGDDIYSKQLMNGNLVVRQERTDNSNILWSNGINRGKREYWTPIRVMAVALKTFTNVTLARIGDCGVFGLPAQVVLPLLKHQHLIAIDEDRSSKGETLQ